MKIGVIGLGKLGLPCTLAMESQTNHDFFGFDISDSVLKSIHSRNVSYWEEGVNELLPNSKLKLVSDISLLVDNCDIIFIAVQTPHEESYEGKTPVPDLKKDFSYKNLILAVQEIARGLALNPNANPLIVIISTVLPGTIRRTIVPILKEVKSNYRLAYNPYFIAMGTTIKDFLNPEFVLIGADNDRDIRELQEFYDFLPSPKLGMAIESAELTKVAYNTYIGFKIVFANSIAEITEKIGGNPDDVATALSLASKRLMSGEYMTAGLGDGGGCHPRDQIAMSWLANEVDLSSDIFNFLAKARDLHASKLARVAIKLASESKLPIALLGTAYKPNSPIDTGSPAKLLEHFLELEGSKVVLYDPWVLPESQLPETPHFFILGVRHKVFKDILLPEGSVMFDPWGFYDSQRFPYKLERFGRK
jgi:UDPglucose 6-dehydrogenase